MISFINAKINLGLNIIRKREDGYHELETVFYPIGLYNGTPVNPEPFCDILEITRAEPCREKDDLKFTGNAIDCRNEDNLVAKALNLFKIQAALKNAGPIYFDIKLEKHIPFGAGLGGGSADAAFTLVLLNNLTGNQVSKAELIEMATRLGADCPFFIENQPVIARGIGELMEPVNIDLSGYWLALVKPPVFISTKEAFAGITPTIPEVSIKDIVCQPVDEWEKSGLKNDFEFHIFKLHPGLQELKDSFYEAGALYAAMSGSGSSIFGIFRNKEAAEAALEPKKHFVTFLIRM